MTAKKRELDIEIEGPYGIEVKTLKQAKKMQKATSRVSGLIEKRLAESGLSEKERKFLADTRDLCELLHAVCKEQVDIAESMRGEEKA